MKLLALDFDGVISDSAREAFLVALRTYHELHPSSSLPEPRQAPETEGLYARFVELMPLGNRAEDFAVALAALESGTELQDQAEYDRYFASQSATRLQQFHTRFYEHRHAWSDRDPEEWLSLMAPYPEIVDLLKRRGADTELAIATAKDRDSVEKLLVRYGLEDLFAKDRLLDKETGRDKRAHLEAIRERTGVPAAEILFVDDKLNHLDSVRALGVRTALAGWGYNGQREQMTAEGSGHIVLQLETVEDQLFGG